MTETKNKKNTSSGQRSGIKKQPTAKSKAAKEQAVKSRRIRTLKSGVGTIVYVTLAIIFFLSFVMFDPNGNLSGSGLVGTALAKLFNYLTGNARYVFPFWLLLMAVYTWKNKDGNYPFVRQTIVTWILFVAVAAMFGAFGDYAFFKQAITGNGGLIGGVFAFCFLKAFNLTVTIIILLAIIVICAIILGGNLLADNLSYKLEARRNQKAHLREEAARREAEREAAHIAARAEAKQAKRDARFAAKAARKANKIKDVSVIGEEKAEDQGPVKDLNSNYPSFLQHLDASQKSPYISDEPDLDLKDILADIKDVKPEPEIPVVSAEPPILEPVVLEEIDVTPIEVDSFDGNSEDSLGYFQGETTPKDDGEVTPESTGVGMSFGTVEPLESKEVKGADTACVSSAGSQKTTDPKVESVQEQESEKTSEPKPYVLPKTDILNPVKKSSNPSVKKNIQDSVGVLEKTLESFGVNAKVTDVSCGPAIIRYEVQPGPGVKVSKIVGLTDDIALQLKATGIRMEAPVPGKSVIGIEVPRAEKTAVYFRDILENSTFFDNPSKLLCAFGMDITGNPVLGDLAAMPHLLIAGSTGSGKSVCMNTIICSLLFRAKPDEVKFIMIDPKRVEFAAYEGLPHLITPVVTDPKKAAGALRWALREMENRYTLFNMNKVKNLEGYNRLVGEHDKLPQIVIFIDELSDLMMVAAKDVEEAICRLAQMARAAGIHLVIATQRPSVDVITGLIKTNIPSRIAFAVSSQIDSRTILDMGGAEKLLGKGDMLYHPVGLPKAVRVQGAFLSEDEAEALIEHCKKQGSPDFVEGVTAEVTEEKAEGGFDDELFLDAAKAVITAGQASTSMLQRRFRIGYNRAARLMEDLQDKAIVGPPDGARPRQILMTLDAFLLKYVNVDTKSDDGDDDVPQIDEGTLFSSDLDLDKE